MPDQSNEQTLTEMPDGSVIVEDPSFDDEADPSAAFGDNLAASLDTFTLNTIASSFIELIERDREARKERDKQQEEGIRRTGLGGDAPGGANFDGASKVVHPALAEGCVDFSARAIKELFPANGPVKTKTLGKVDEQKLEKARRKRDFLNFYMTTRMPEYRDEKEILLTQLPLGGSQYEKFWFDGKRTRMSFAPVDKVLLPFSANSFYNSPRITFERDVTEADVEKDVSSGFYEDVFSVTSEEPDSTASQDATQKIEGKEQSGYNEDGIRTIYEITCVYEVEEGVGPAPYVIHIDSNSERICAIYRNWREGDESKEALQWWVEDKFIPWRGAYGIGLPHLIGGMSAALTGALRALLDSAHINNAPTAIKLKSGRSSGQNVSLEMTSVTEMEAPTGVDDIRKAIMPMPFNPPSTVLFQLLGWLSDQAKGVVATAEERIADAGNNMPVGTTLALIEQGSQVFSAVHARLHESQRRALKIICRIISDYPEHVAEDLARFNLTPEDFAENDDVEPVSDPNIFSESQRYAQMQAVMQLASGDAQDPSMPWNKIAIRRRMLELLRIDGIDELLPKPPQPLTSDPISENVAVMQGAIVRAMPQQDHQAHIKTHLLFILQPMIAQGPADGQKLAGLMAHIQDHLLQDYQHSMKAAEILVASQSGAESMSPDVVAFKAALMAHDRDSEMQAKLLPEIQQAQQIVQSKMPPPPVDQAVQATKEVAMAQIQQKVQEFQANQQFEQQKWQYEAQLKERAFQAEPIMEAMKREFEAKIELERIQRQDEAERYRQQVELIKNEQDNKQHQITELIKNQQDNETQINAKMIELRGQIEQENQQRISELSSQLQGMLSAVGENETRGAFGSAIERMSSFFKR